MRIYAIGDVHGRLDHLAALLSLINADAADREPMPTQIVMLGNMIDFGPESAAVLDLCMRLSLQNDQFSVLQGRHEAMMIAALRDEGNALEHWLDNGGIPTLTSLGLSDDMSNISSNKARLAIVRQSVASDLVQWLDSLPSRLNFLNYSFRTSKLCSKSTLSADAQASLQQNSGFIFRRNLAFRLTIRQLIAEDVEASDDDTGRSPETLAAVGLEGGERWIIRATQHGPDNTGTR